MCYVDKKTYKQFFQIHSTSMHNTLYQDVKLRTISTAIVMSNEANT
jgi:hypothetical protein